MARQRRPRDEREREAYEGRRADLLEVARDAVAAQRRQNRELLPGERVYNLAQVTAWVGHVAGYSDAAAKPAWPSHETLAGDLGGMHPRTSQRTSRAAEALGLIEVERRPCRGDGTRRAHVNRYHLRPPPPEPGEQPSHARTLWERAQARRQEASQRTRAQQAGKRQWAATSQQVDDSGDPRPQPPSVAELAARQRESGDGAPGSLDASQADNVRGMRDRLRRSTGPP